MKISYHRRRKIKTRRIAIRDLILRGIEDPKESDDMDTIKKAYRQLIRKYHPDIISSQNKDESYMEKATSKTQEINQAYQVIKDEKK